MSQVVAHDEDIVIAGGGIAGLAAARFLVLAGHAPQRITVREKNPYLGGHARTLYLFKDASGFTRIITAYEIDLGDATHPQLRPLEPTDAFLAQFPSGSVSLDDPRILPTDTGFTIFTDRYTNYRRLLSLQTAHPIFDTSMKSDLRRSYHLKNDVLLESYLPLFGLWRHPLRFVAQIPSLLQLKRLMRSFLSSVDGLDLDSMTVDALFRQQGIDGTLFADLARALVRLYSGYSSEQTSATSARYLVDFLRISKLETGFDGVTTTLLGNSLTIATLVAELRREGVTFEMASAWDGARPAEGHVLFAMHPWQIDALADLDFPSVRVPVYLNTSEWGHLGADAHYRDTAELTHATLDIDRYRPDFPDFGVQITFGTSGSDDVYESKILADARREGIDRDVVGIAAYRGEPIQERAIKLEWEHAHVTPDFERSRLAVRSRQGVDRRWYASASLSRCARHEDGVTSALETVLLMKGDAARATLEGKGFRAHT